MSNDAILLSIISKLEEKDPVLFMEIKKVYKIKWLRTVATVINITLSAFFLMQILNQSSLDLETRNSIFSIILGIMTSTLVLDTVSVLRFTINKEKLKKYVDRKTTLYKSRLTSTVDIIVKVAKEQGKSEVLMSTIDDIVSSGSLLDRLFSTMGNFLDGAENDPNKVTVIKTDIDKDSILSESQVAYLITIRHSLSHSSETQ